MPEQEQAITITFETRIRRGIDGHADLPITEEYYSTLDWDTVEEEAHAKNRLCLIAEIRFYLPQNPEEASVFTWDTETRVWERVSLTDSEYSLSKAFPFSGRGVEQARKWLEWKKKQAIGDLAAIKRSYQKIQECLFTDYTQIEKVQI